MPLALHIYIVRAIGKQFIEREFEVYSGPLIFFFIFIIRARLIFLDVAKLCSADFHVVKYHRALIAHIATILIILYIFLIVDIGKANPYIV